MSRRPHRRQSAHVRTGCRSGKARYIDHIAARVALAEVQRKNNRQPAEQRAYRCHLCRGWHLTSQPRRDR